MKIKNFVVKGIRCFYYILIIFTFVSTVFSQTYIGMGTFSSSGGYTSSNQYNTVFILGQSSPVGHSETDNYLNNGGFLSLIIDNANTTGINEMGDHLPEDFSLDQNYPNPFNPETVIPYQVSAKSHIRLVVYDIIGRKIKTLVDGSREAGVYNVNWNGKDDFGGSVSSGVYFVRMECEKFVENRKMIKIK